MTLHRRTTGQLMGSLGGTDGAAIYVSPNQSVRRDSARPERRRRKFPPETLRTGTADGGRCKSAGFWRAVDPHCFHHRRGAALAGADLSGNRTEGRQAPVTKALRLPPFLFGSVRLRRLTARDFRRGSVEDRPRFSSCTRSWARASWIFRRWTCRCSKLADREHHACAAPPACSTCRTMCVVDLVARACARCCTAAANDVAKPKRPARRSTAASNEPAGSSTHIVYYLSDPGSAPW